MAGPIFKGHSLQDRNFDQIGSSNVKPRRRPTLMLCMVSTEQERSSQEDCLHEECYGSHGGIGIKKWKRRVN
jgi:hypothetical protein